MRWQLLVFLVGCGAAQQSSTRAATDAECPRVARHLIEIGPVDRWIKEAHGDSLLPIDGVDDRAGLEKLFDLACRENWEVAQRRCIAAQQTWDDVERACASEKVWWFQPS